MTDESLVRICKCKLPTAVIKPTYFTVCPYAHMMSRRLAGRMILEAYIGKIEVVYQAKFVDTYVELSVR
jgi:hypothetical protein